MSENQTKIDRTRSTATASPPRSTRQVNPRAVVAGVVFIAVIGLAIWYLARPEPLLVQGEVDSTRIDIAARVPGRLAKLAVARGQDVAAGALLLAIDNPELIAELHAAEAEKSVAVAELARINAGTRSEIIALRRAEIDRAEAELTLAQETYNRTHELAAREVASQSKLDEATNALTVAGRRLEQAKLAYQEAVRGFTAEEHEIAEANVAKAAAKIETTKALVDQLTITAPVASQVYQNPGRGGRGRHPSGAAPVAGGSRRYLARLLAARGPARGRQAGRPDRGSRPRVGQPRDHRRNSPDRRERRVCRLARDAGDRRFRAAHLRDPGISRREDRRLAAGHERLHRVDAAIAVRPPPRPGLWLVAIREIRFFRRDPAGLFLILAIPLIAFAVLAWTFSGAVVRGLDVVVVDMDRSAVSAEITQAIAAAAGLRVAERADNLTAATQAIRSGRAIAAVYIPPEFERDLMAGRRPQIVAFYNEQYFTPGNIAASGLRSAVSAATSRLSPLHEVQLQPIGSGPLTVEQYVLTNPALNYAGFLLRAVMPTTLHVVMAIAACYAVGTEFSRRSLRAWLRCAGGSPLSALLGKLLPLFAVFFSLLAVDALILDGGFALSYRGDVLMIVVAAMLFIAAYLSLAALLPLLVRDLPLGLSLNAIVASPAFGFAGVGLPVLAMHAFPRGWGALLPLRWYLQILTDQAARGAPVHASALPFAILAGMAIGLFALTWLRLRLLSPGHREAEPPLPQDGAGLRGSFAGEWRRVLADRGVFSLMIVAPVFYGIFYPQPYLGQLVRKLPIAVVDDDRTPMSRRLIQALDADEAISVAVRAPALDVAQQALFDRQVFGIVDIPRDTERYVLRGDAARLPAYVDSAYFLVFNRAVQGILESAADVNVANIAHGLRQNGAVARLGLAAVSPVELLMEPLYNPTGGYASYVVPAAFVLIIQQTLLMGAATLAALAFARPATPAPGAAIGPGRLLGRALAHVTIYVPALALFLVVLPRIYGFSTLGRLGDMALFALPFILATSFMGQAAGSFFKHRETAILVFVATTLPQFFLVGVSWPREMIPPLLNDLRRVFPSESAIDGFVRLNQMGARLIELRADWLYLWLLAAVYFGLAVMAARRRASIGMAYVA